MHDKRFSITYISSLSGMVSVQMLTGKAADTSNTGEASTRSGRRNAISFIDANRMGLRPPHRFLQRTASICLRILVQTLTSSTDASVHPRLSGYARTISCSHPTLPPDNCSSGFWHIQTNDHQHILNGIEDVGVRSSAYTAPIA